MCLCPVATDHSLLFGCDSLKQVELGFSPQAVCSGLNRAALLCDSPTLNVFFLLLPVYSWREKQLWCLKT